MIAERTGSTTAHATAVFAIVSPAAQLSTALDWTEAILSGDQEQVFGIFGQCVGQGA